VQGRDHSRSPIGPIVGTIRYGWLTMGWGGVALTVKSSTKKPNQTKRPDQVPWTGSKAQQNQRARGRYALTTERRFGSTGKGKGKGGEPSTVDGVKHRTTSFPFRMRSRSVPPQPNDLTRYPGPGQKPYQKAKPNDLTRYPGRTDGYVVVVVVVVVGK